MQEQNWSVKKPGILRTETQNLNGKLDEKDRWWNYDKSQSDVGGKTLRDILNWKNLKQNSTQFLKLEVINQNILTKEERVIT